MARRTPGKVTDAERRLAILQDRDKAALEQIGLAAVQRTGFRAQKAAMAAWRAGNDPTPAVRAVLRRDLLPVLRASMLAGHVSGVRRNRLDLRRQPTIAARLIDPIGGGLGPYSGAVRSMLSMANLTTDRLKKLTAKYGEQATKVLAGVDREVDRKLSKTIAELTAEGAHVREGKKRLAQAFESLGLTPNNSFTLEAIFRTQTAIAYSAGKWNAEQDPEVQEILWGYRYVTVGDDRVRPEHEGYDGVTLPKDDPFWLASTPPNGWACRCATIPVFDEQAIQGPQTVDVDGRDVAPSTDPGFAVSFGAMIGA